jgi:arginase
MEGDRRRNRLKDASVGIDVFQVPIALGANREGADQGAAALDEALRRRLTGNGASATFGRLKPSQVIPVPSLDEARHRPATVDNALHLESVAEATGCLAEALVVSLRSGHFGLCLGGDHSLSIGSLAGASSLGRLGVLWIDAHADINTPATSPSGHVHGMPVAAALGYGAPAVVNVGHRFDVSLDDIVYIGLRDVDPGEQALLKQSAALCLTMEHVDEMGMAAVIRAAFRRLAERGVDAVHVSFDLDVLDPTVMPGTGTTVDGGLTFREARLLARALQETDLSVVSLDIVELNPLLDPSGRSTEVAAHLAALFVGEERV